MPRTPSDSRRQTIPWPPAVTARPRRLEPPTISEPTPPPGRSDVIAVLPPSPRRPPSSPPIPKSPSWPGPPTGASRSTSREHGPRISSPSTGSRRCAESAAPIRSSNSAPPTPCPNSNVSSLETFRCWASCSRSSPPASSAMGRPSAATSAPVRPSATPRRRCWPSKPNSCSPQCAGREPWHWPTTSPDTGRRSEKPMSSSPPSASRCRCPR